MKTFKFVGSKSKLLPDIKKYIPKDTTVIFEPFCGSASLSFDLEMPFYISDTSEELINFYQVLKDKTKLGSLIDTLNVHKKVSNEHHYNIIRAEDQLKSFSMMSTVQRAARYYYILLTGFNGLYRVNQKGFCNTPFGKREFRFDPNHLIKMSDYMNKYCRGVHVKEFDNMDLLIASLDSDEKPFVFIDSPYFPGDDGKKVYTEYTKEGIRGDFIDRYEDYIHDLFISGVSFLATNTWCTYMRTRFSSMCIDKIPTKYTIAADGSRRGEKFEAFVSPLGPIEK